MQPPDRHRFIPFSRHAIVEMVMDEAQARGAAIDEQQLRSLARLVRAIFHFQFHEQLEALKQRYAPFDGDAQGARANTEQSQATDAGASPGEQDARALEAGLEHVLEKGNYESVGEEELARAFEESSLIPLRVEVDTDAYDRLLLFSRGESEQRVRLKSWFGLRSKWESVPSFDRVCMYVRFKPESSPASKESDSVAPARVTLKLFRNIPKADLEMLLPDCRTRMRGIDKLLIIVPALFGGVPVVIKVAPLLVLLAVILGLTQHPIDHASLTAGLIGAITLGAYLFQRWENFKSRKLNFAKTLSENLYFRNLDNNQGVLTRLVDEAEEEECKEALLGYAFLLWSSEPLDAEGLDRAIESWFRERHDVELDFEVSDALDKLERLEIVRRSDDATLTPLPLDAALLKLRERWATLPE